MRSSFSCAARLVSAGLSLTLTLSILPSNLWLDIVRAEKPSYVRQCAEYKTTLQFDRTKVSNHPLSYWQEDNTPANTAKNNTTLLTVKDDQLCMHLADLERKRSKTADSQLRAALTQQIAAATAEQLTVQENLRAAVEREERLRKLAETLKALARDGNVTIMQRLTDERARMIETLAIAYETEVARISTDTARAATIRTELKKYQQLSTADQSRERILIRDRVRLAYAALQRQVQALKQEFSAKIITELVDTLLASERQKYVAAMEIEVSDPAERTTHLAAIDGVIAEKQAIYTEKLTNILEAAFVEIETLSGVINDAVGITDQTSQHSTTPTAATHAFLIASSSADVVRAMEQSTILPIASSVTDKFAATQKLLISFTQLAHSADLALVRILSETNTTKLFIELVEKNNQMGLMEQLNRLDTSTKNKIQTTLDQERTKTKASSIAVAAVKTGVLPENFTLTPALTKDVCLAKYGTSTLIFCDSVAKITTLTGDHGREIITLFASRTLQENSTYLVDFIAREIEWLNKKMLDPRTIVRGQRASELRWRLVKTVLNNPTMALTAKSNKKGDEKKQYATYQAELTRLVAQEAAIWSNEHPKNCSTAQKAWFDALKQIDAYGTRTPALHPIKCEDLPWGRFTKNNGIVKTTNATETIESASGTYIYDKSTGAVIQKRGGVLVSISIVSKTGLPWVIIDGTKVAMIFGYDAKGQVTERRKITLHNGWSSDGEWFTKTPNNLVDRVTWIYRGAQIRERQEYIGDDTIPSKVIRYTYLDEAINGRGSLLTGNYKTQLNYLAENLPLIHEMGGGDTLTSTLISRVEVKNANNTIVTRNYFYYSDFLILDFIQENHLGKERWIGINQPLNQARDITKLRELYPTLSFTDTVRFSGAEYDSRDLRQVNPVTLMDSDGTILSQPITWCDKAAKRHLACTIVAGMSNRAPGEKSATDTALAKALTWAQAKLNGITKVVKDPLFTTGAIEQLLVYAEEKADKTLPIADPDKALAKIAKKVAFKAIFEIIYKSFGEQVIKKIAEKSVPVVGWGLAIVGGGFTAYDLWKIYHGADYRLCLAAKHAVALNCGHLSVRAVAALINLGAQFRNFSTVVGQAPSSQPGWNKLIAIAKAQGIEKAEREFDTIFQGEGDAFEILQAIKTGEIPEEAVAKSLDERKKDLKSLLKMGRKIIIKTSTY